ncbi:hypothetical protein [Peribacillus sp. JNUCC41]|nr:hypothetical protein [Brevibacillus sp. JNUCC-41]QOS89948.1 hypothetical protein JNUCC41_25105 [Brevibacillus sp. JNUCC-41]
MSKNMSLGMVPGACWLAFMVMLFTACSYGKIIPSAGLVNGYTKKSIYTYSGCFLAGKSILMNESSIRMGQLIVVPHFLYSITSVPDYASALNLLIISTFCQGHIHRFIHL